MKKLLKNFAILTVFAFGLFTGCNNDASIDLNVTVSTDTPSLDEPKNLGYGVLLTWGITQDDNNFRVTRQAKDGKEKILDEISDNRYIDGVGFDNVLEEGVEYTYRVYNLGGNAYSADNGVVKYSYAEKKITLAAGSLKKQGEKLDAVKEADVKMSFKNSNLKINFLNDENFVWDREVVVRDAETGRKVEYGYIDRLGISGYDAEKVNVEIKNVDDTGYYADSDVVTIKDIENTVAEEIYISDLKATVRDKTVVLLWTTKEKVEASEFTIQRTNYAKKYNPRYDETSYIEIKTEILKITPAYEEKYDGTYYWKAIDESVESGMRYEYTVITDSNSNYNNTVTEDIPGNIEITDVVYSNVDNAVILTWKAEDVSDFKIYRADGDLSQYSVTFDEEGYYDLYKPLDIKNFEKVDTLDDGYIVYTAKDTTVEKDKEYTYRILSTDGLDCSWNWCVKTFQSSYISGDISLNLYLNDSYVSYYDTISDKNDDIRLSFDNGNKNVTYKGYYTTVDNKGNESARTEFTFTKDNDSHYRKTFKASAITGLNKAVSVNFYVKCYDGDKLLSHWEYDDYEGRSVEKYEYTKTLFVSSSLTTYTTLNVYARQEDYSKKEITIYAYGNNLDAKVITVTYFKDDGEVKPATLTWTKVSDGDYKATLTVTETGNYRICATIPEDNAYNSTYDYYTIYVD